MSSYKKESVRFMRIKAVSEHIHLSESTIRRYVKDGEFPTPIKLGKRTKVWKEQVVYDWYNSLGGE
jgi:predicted DNA-binding transcriptional regulator AlpA